MTSYTVRHAHTPRGFPDRWPLPLAPCVAPSQSEHTIALMSKTRLEIPDFAKHWAGDVMLSLITNLDLKSLSPVSRAFWRQNNGDVIAGSGYTLSCPT